jgi:hypothetical protein
MCVHRESIGLLVHREKTELHVIEVELTQVQDICITGFNIIERLVPYQSGVLRKYFPWYLLCSSSGMAKPISRPISESTVNLSEVLRYYNLDYIFMPYHFRIT